jgi:hypothetical protein
VVIGFGIVVLTIIRVVECIRNSFDLLEMVDILADNCGLSNIIALQYSSITLDHSLLTKDLVQQFFLTYFLLAACTNGRLNSEHMNHFSDPYGS